jgi:2,3,4,5-tetrahydropyridine-2,6-dicarboxylate N-succinyltransferase
MTDFVDVQRRIEAAFADRAKLSDPLHHAAVVQALHGLDRGELRVAEKVGEEWKVNAWLMQAVNLFFAVQGMKTEEFGPFQIRDKIPLKKDLEKAGVRVVPGGVARFGSHLEPGAVLMPGFVNIGARVGVNSMVDTWATVGSCAQVGANVHLAGGVGIGGVLEPPGARPNIIEDGAFVGSRCILVEGVLVEEDAVLGANVVITASTPIIDVTGPQEVVYKGRVPARSVVIPGTRPKQYPAGIYQIPCALIVGRRSPATDKKVSLNQALRDFEVQV